MNTRCVRGNGRVCRRRARRIDARPANLVASEVVEPDAGVEYPLLGQVDRIGQVRSDRVDGSVVDLSFANDLVDLGVWIGRERPQDIEVVGHIIAVPVDCLASDLHARYNSMMEGAGAELYVQLGLVGIDPGNLIAVWMVHVGYAFHRRGNVIETALSNSGPVGHRHARHQFDNRRSRDDVRLLLEEVEANHADPQCCERRHAR